MENWYIFIHEKKCNGCHISLDEFINDIVIITKLTYSRSMEKIFIIKNNIFYELARILSFTFLRNFSISGALLVSFTKLSGVLFVNRFVLTVGEPQIITVHHGCVKWLRNLQRAMREIERFTSQILILGQHFQTFKSLIFAFSAFQSCSSR